MALAWEREFLDTLEIQNKGSHLEELEIQHNLHDQTGGHRHKIMNFAFALAELQNVPKILDCSVLLAN